MCNIDSKFVIIDYNYFYQLEDKNEHYDYRITLFISYKVCTQKINPY